MSVLTSWALILAIFVCLMALAKVMNKIVDWWTKTADNRWCRKHYYIDYHNMEKHRTRWENR